MANNKKQYRQRELQQDLIAKSQSEFFGNMTKDEAIDIFKTLSLLAQFPGATPPEPLTGCDITWTSTMKVGDSRENQKFTVQAIYKDMTFTYTSNGQQIIQLPDSSSINLTAWDYHALLIANRILNTWK